MSWSPAQARENAAEGSRIEDWPEWEHLLSTPWLEHSLSLE